MVWDDAASLTRVSFFSVVIIVMTIIGGCSSTPEPQPGPSKQEIRQDSDRFFQKMGGEENKKSPSP